MVYRWIIPRGNVKLLLDLKLNDKDLMSNDWINSWYFVSSFVDINECNVSNGGCHDNATCANVPGSRTCRCKQGFYGDGIGLCMGKE